MIVLNTWQLISAVVLIFLFGFGIGRTFGELRAWKKMEREEEQEKQKNG